MDVTDGALQEAGTNREVLDETLDPEDLLSRLRALVDRGEPLAALDVGRAHAALPAVVVAENFEWWPTSSSAK